MSDTALDGFDCVGHRQNENVIVAANVIGPFGEALTTIAALVELADEFGREAASRDARLEPNAA